jgi:hypothetical protein
MKPEELINLAKAETEMFERPARRTSCLMVEMIQVMVERIAELEEELKFLYEVACEGTNPEWLQEQINALKEQVK